MSNSSADRLVLVTGGTGYVGGRLVPHLLNMGYRVRVLVRDAQRLQGRPWVNQVDILECDVLRSETEICALDGVWVAYYLIHSMMRSDDFHARDIQAARNFGQSAQQAGVKRIIYLGGLGNPDAQLSKHLSSRQETGAALKESGVPVTEFRAGVIVGSGSVSFEMIRYLTERLPVMICPQWVYTRTQPIAIANVMDYLTQALENPSSTGKVIEIGGADIVTYGEMMQGYAQVRGLKRYLIPVPVLTPRLSSYWVHWMTPIPAQISGPLIEGLRNEVIVRDDLARHTFPNIHPIGYREAVQLALDNLQASQIETRWSDSLSSSQGDVLSVTLTTTEGMIIERRQKLVKTTPENIFASFTHLGGETGWLYMSWAWRIRGGMDRLVGGVGLRRGRRHPSEVRVGDAIDFWRAEAIETPSLLRLRAEMKVPGRAWLQFESLPDSDDQSLLIQTAFFAPKGLFGFLYWYILYPIHSLIFSGMINAIAEQAVHKSVTGQQH